MLKTTSKGTSQDTEKARPDEGNSQTYDHIGRDKLGHGKKTTGRGVLTFWGPHQEGTCQDKEIMRPSEGRSQPEGRVVRGKAEHGKRTTKQVTLTSWRSHGKRQVSVSKGCDRARGTHNLETALGGTSKDKVRKRLSEWHSLS